MLQPKKVKYRKTQNRRRQRSGGGGAKPAPDRPGKDFVHRREKNAFKCAANFYQCIDVIVSCFAIHNTA